MHLNWVLVASKMQSLRHGFAKRTPTISQFLTLSLNAEQLNLENAFS
ncbi:MAG: hypothetical protein ACLFT9_10775 [Coleofasciculus sp.]